MKSKTGIWYYIKNYKFNSVFIKNFLLITLLVVLPLAGMSIVVYIYYNNVMKEEIGIANTNVLSKVRDMVDMIASETDKLSIRIASDIDVGGFLAYDKPEIPDYDTVLRLQNIDRIISISSITSTYIDSIYVFSKKNNYIITSTRGASEIERFFDTGWNSDNMNKKEQDRFWICARQVKEIYKDGKALNFISAFRTAPFYSQEQMGVVIINIDADKLRQLINNVSNKEHRKMFIVEVGGNILFSTDVSFTGKNIRDVEFLGGVKFKDDSNPVIINNDGIKEVISFVDSQYSNWKYISVIPLRQYEQKTTYLKRFMAVFIVLSVIIAVILAFLISISIFKPIKNVISILEDPEEWINIESMKKNTGIDEFKYIVSNIIRSYDHNKWMEHELAQRLSLLKKAKAVALQSQINPHFLYNTLETINWMAMKLTKGKNEVTYMISCLSGLLRLNFETEDNLISIRDEVEYAHRYVEIQKVRYRNKFVVIWEIDEEVLDCRIVKITLQPLIENAIYHGIKPKGEKGIIRITGCVQKDCILLEVIDDGVGMTPEEVIAINDDLRNDYIKEDKHIGIRNVNQRIKLIFGDDYGLTVESDSCKGTVVKIITPKVK